MTNQQRRKTSGKTPPQNQNRRRSAPRSSQPRAGTSSRTAPNGRSQQNRAAVASASAAGHSGAVPQGPARTGKPAAKKKKRRLRQKTVDGVYVSKGYKEKILAGPIDVPFLIIVIVLLVLGLIMLFSASYPRANYETNNTDGLFYVKRQAMFAAVGLAAMFIISHIDYHLYHKAWIAFGAYFGAMGLVALTLILPNRRQDDFRRWIYIGPAENPYFSMQPSEVLKLGIIILFAYLISVNYERMKTFQYGIMPFAILLGAAAALVIAQKHISATVIICAIGVFMMFVGGVSWRHILVIGGIGVIVLVGVVYYLVVSGSFEHVMPRIRSWQDPFADTKQDTWQTQQSLIAIGSGGIFGLGLGNSRQKYLYLPEVENDFVFAIVCEELGLVGAIAVILLFALFIFRGFYISTKAPDKFGMMLAVGVTIQIGLQALLNIAVVTNTIPNTGISLPFFSYGGTALCMQLAEMGLVLSVSRHAMIEPA